MYSKDTMWSVVWNNSRFDSSTLADLQQYGAEKYFAKQNAMVNIPPPMREDVDPAVDVARYLSDGAGIIASTVT